MTLKTKKFYLLTPSFSPVLVCCLAVVDVCAVPSMPSSMNVMKHFLFHFNAQTNYARMIYSGLLKS
jgi:hypothetical protein